MKILFFSIVLISQISLAATPVTTQVPNMKDLRDRFKSILKNKKPLSQYYIGVEKEYGEKAIPVLLQAANSDSETDEFRWASLFGLAKISGNESLPTIKKFMKNRNWFMRDAALKSSVMVCKNLKAKDECNTSIKPELVHLLKDESLIVRTSTVDAIGELQYRDLDKNLTNILFDSMNFNKGSPLWIHKHVLETFQRLKLKSVSTRLVDFLESQRHEGLRVITIKTLEVLTGKSFPGKSTSEQVFLWKRSLLSEKTF